MLLTSHWWKPGILLSPTMSRTAPAPNKEFPEQNCPSAMVRNLDVVLQRGWLRKIRRREAYMSAKPTDCTASAWPTLGFLSFLCSFSLFFPWLIFPLYSWFQPFHTHLLRNKPSFTWSTKTRYHDHSHNLKPSRNSTSPTMPWILRCRFLSLTPGHNHLPLWTHHKCKKARDSKWTVCLIEFAHFNSPHLDDHTYSLLA